VLVTYQYRPDSQFWYGIKQISNNSYNVTNVNGNCLALITPMRSMEVMSLMEIISLIEIMSLVGTIIMALFQLKTLIDSLLVFSDSLHLFSLYANITIHMQVICGPVKTNKKYWQNKLFL
jgi:hypothetical protein